MQVPLDGSHAGRAAIERRTIVVPDLTKVGEEFEPCPSVAGQGFVAYYAVPLLAKGHIKGVLEVFHRDPLDPDHEWLDFLEALAGQAAIAVDYASLVEGLQIANVELMLAYNATIEGWAAALDLRDKETEGHTRRVTKMAVHLAEAMGLSGPELAHVRRGSILHDIGKLGVPDAVLNKPGPLNEEEWAVMRLPPDLRRTSGSHRSTFCGRRSTFHTATTRNGTAVAIRAACEGSRSPCRRGCSPPSMYGMPFGQTVPTADAGPKTECISTFARWLERTSTRR